MDNDTLTQFEQINTKMRKIIYFVEQQDNMLFDLDSTLLDTYGSQEGESFIKKYFPKKPNG